MTESRYTRTDTLADVLPTAHERGDGLCCCRLNARIEDDGSCRTCGCPPQHDEDDYTQLSDAVPGAQEED